MCSPALRSDRFLRIEPLIGGVRLQETFGERPNGSLLEEQDSLAERPAVGRSVRALAVDEFLGCAFLSCELDGASLDLLGREMTLFH